jgi:hypothetical protein
MAELFANVQINREPRWQILSKLAVASLALHATVLASLIYVPAVRDMFNIAALLSDTGYVDKAYTRTEIGEDVQMLQLPPAKFHYPAGYFATETQLQLAQAIQATAVAPPVTVDLTQLSTPTPSPTPEASPSLAAEASPAASPTSSPTEVTAEKAKSETPKTPEEAEAELNRIAAANNVVRPSESEINTRPLKEWLARSEERRNKGELDLTSAVEITIAGKLNPECRLIEANVVQKTGDARLVEVAKEMVGAIGDSGMLSFLRDPKKKMQDKVLTCDEMPLQLTIKLDQSEISAIVETEATSPQRASEMAVAYNYMLVAGQVTAAAKSKDEEVLYRNTKVTSEEKKILVNFKMPRQTASEMLKKQLPKAG